MNRHKPLRRKTRLRSRSLKRKRITPEEWEHLLRVKSLPCIVCKHSPPSLAHHIREGLGMGQKALHFDTIPLCDEHHAGTTVPSIHGARKTFIEAFGTEQELLIKTRVMLGIVKAGV